MSFSIALKISLLIHTERCYLEKKTGAVNYKFNISQKHKSKHVVKLLDKQTFLTLTEETLFPFSLKPAFNNNIEINLTL